jgi:hypothetical protein
VSILSIRRGAGVAFVASVDVGVVHGIRRVRLLWRVLGDGWERLREKGTTDAGQRRCGWGPRTDLATVRPGQSLNTLVKLFDTGQTDEA